MPHCVAFGCNYNTHKNKKSEVSLHRFPSDIHRRSQWEKAVGRMYLPMLPHLCSQHFSPDDFEAPFIRAKLMKELIGGRSIRKLKEDAVPTVFLHKMPQYRQLISERGHWGKCLKETTLEEPVNDGETSPAAGNTCGLTNPTPDPTRLEPSLDPRPEPTLDSVMEPEDVMFHKPATHVTIRKGLTFPPLRKCTTCCPPGLYHCPFCSPSFFKPTKRSRVMVHLEIHIRRACFIGEFTAHKCSLDCVRRPHYHCLYCISPLLSRQDLIRHVRSCQEKPRTTGSQEDPGAELGGAVDLPHSVESEDDSETDDIYIIPDPQDRTNPEGSGGAPLSHFLPRPKRSKMAESHRRQCHRMVQTSMERPQDCDEFYFMNLVKTFKKLSPHKKTEVRMKIERILFEAEFQ